MTSLLAFSQDQFEAAKRLLATQVAQMLGRKLEEGDWTTVYCRAKGIPDTGWSNLHIDIEYDGLGVEFKMLRCAKLNRLLKKTNDQDRQVGELWLQCPA